MTTRLLKASASELKNMNSRELLESIYKSEGRTVMTEVITPLLPACSTATGGTADATASSSTDGTSVDGSYTGSAKGMNGSVDVTVTLKDGAIEAITVDSQSETVGFGDVAVEKLPERNKSDYEI